jgi:hypothetical protein
MQIGIRTAYLKGRYEEGAQFMLTRTYYEYSKSRREGNLRGKWGEEEEARENEKCVDDGRTWWEDKVLVATRAPFDGKLLNQHRQDVVSRVMLPQEDPT